MTGVEALTGFSINCSFDLRIDTPCDALDTFEDTAQTGVEDGYSGETKYFTLTPFTVEPSVCDDSTITYTCTGVSGPDAGDYSGLCTGWTYPADANGNLGLTANPADKDGTLPPGVYTFTITATGLDGQTETGTFTWTLSDGVTCA